jgi:Uma2 family endonuclease
MTTRVRAELDPERDLYPDSDGQPMAENTLQFQWIVTLQGNLDALFREDRNVFVAGDLLWYAVEGDPTARVAPDAMVVFGRPKGYRGSYKQWREGGIPPQVVFEVLSPGNRPQEMVNKFQFYDQHGVEEYYLYNPEEGTLSGWQRRDGSLQPIEPIDGWVSPLLKVRFDLSAPELVIYRPDGGRFLTFLELEEQREHAGRQVEEAHRLAGLAQRQAEEAQRLARQAQGLTQEAQRQAQEAQRREETVRRQAEEARRQVEESQRREETARREAEEARQREETARRQAEEARQRAERLAERLRALGIDPEA